MTTGKLLMFKKWWRRLKIRNGSLKWIRIRDSDTKMKIYRDRPVLFCQRTKVQFLDGTVRHDLKLRVVSMGGYCIDRDFTGVSHKRYRTLVRSYQSNFYLKQVVVQKRITREVSQNTFTELWRVSERYREEWELRYWELHNGVYTEHRIQGDAMKLLGMSPNVGIGTHVCIGNITICNTASDIMLFMLTTDGERVRQSLPSS